ncbi:hypothetical protein [Alteromonas sp. KUL106]|uniref:hypothetical protein n=1 Tax=Alteromonas sp. KUL106 TaxID=2480799 RepID=UPI0012E4E22A|nr:hypothetical protein [Alteromonas sp. KUL106]GFD68971.1 hypothetical protein KUL106_22340 [Alteromonas sp. KUL106]
MEDKEYFTITEIKSSVSKSDLFYAVQSRELVFSFFIPEMLYIAVEPYSEGKVGQIVLAYEGIISLTSDDSIRLIHEKSLQLTSVKLANRANATVHAIDYPFQLKLPNPYMNSWRPRKLRDMPVSDIEAIVMAKEVIDERKLLSSILKSHNIPQDIPQVIKSNSISIKLEDAVVRRDHLLHANLLSEPKVTISDDIGRSNLSTGNHRSNQFHELLTELIRIHPKLSKKQCEKILRQEVELSKDERSYDRKGIILDISDTELLWESSYGNQQTIKLNSLGTILSKVRKKINAS